MSEQLKEVLKKAEIKRVSERLTKKELCNIYEFNYNFYMNCVSGRNFPSKKMADSLEEYLETPTADVYNMVFASRDKEKDFHDALHIEEAEVNSLIKHLTQEDIFREPQA